jgi:nucleotide-binding universal stress UspA family protein
MRPKIFVPFDFSDTAEAAVAWAVDLHKTVGAEPIRSVYAINARPVGTAEVSLDMLLPNEDEIARMERKMVTLAEAGGGRATAEVRIRLSAIGDILVDAAREAGAELIVMGTHGRTGVRRLVLGSAAAHLLRHADCPVVAVHAARERQAAR